MDKPLDHNDVIIIKNDVIAVDNDDITVDNGGDFKKPLDQQLGTAPQMDCILSPPRLPEQQYSALKIFFSDLQ